MLFRLMGILLAISLFFTFWPTSLYILAVVVALAMLLWFSLGLGAPSRPAAPATATAPAPAPLPAERLLPGKYRAGERVRVVRLSAHQQARFNEHCDPSFYVYNGATGTVVRTEYCTGGYQGRPVWVHLDVHGSVRLETHFRDEELASE